MSDGCLDSSRVLKGERSSGQTRGVKHAQCGIRDVLHLPSFILRDLAAGDPEDDEDEEEEKKKSEEDEEDDDDEEEEETWQVGGAVKRDFSPLHSFTSSF